VTDYKRLAEQEIEHAGLMQSVVPKEFSLRFAQVYATLAVVDAIKGKHSTTPEEIESLIQERDQWKTCYTESVDQRWERAREVGVLKVQVGDQKKRVASLQADLAVVEEQRDSLRSDCDQLVKDSNAWESAFRREVFQLADQCTQIVQLKADLAKFHECEVNARCIIDRSLTGYDPPEEHPFKVWHKEES
jgi:chromosome segregation ATPase